MTTTSTEFGPEASARMKGVTVVKPIVCGNVARYFRKKREKDGHTHQWTVYVKPYINEDMSVYVKKVHFKLHESYANQNRVVTQPPYEVSETGWGEFEIVIKIYFHDPDERPLTFYHNLKLSLSSTEIAEGKNSLVSESYEEIIFRDPTTFMHHLLTRTHPVTTGNWNHEADSEDKKNKSLQNILQGKAAIRKEMNELKDKLERAEEIIVKFKNEIERS